MAIKKNELYSSLWASCDKLRGGMDASQYKDYILTLLFVKYVTDKFKGVKYADITVPEGGSFDDIVALKNNPNIGEEMDKVIAKLAEAGSNQLHGVIDNAHFNDESKLGKGQEMVDKLTGLIGIFQRPEFDFKNNKANGDDILGDAYEYLMRNFATESGKSKGQFYTPAEVSRILAKVIGIDVDMQTQQSKDNPILSNLKKEKKQVDASLANLLKAIEQGVVSRTTTSRLQDLESEQEELERKILTEESKSSMMLEKEEIETFYVKALKCESRLIIEVLIKEIVLYNDKMEIYLNTPAKNGPDENRGFSFYNKTMNLRYYSKYSRLFVGESAIIDIRV